MEKQASGFKQIYKKPDEANVRAWIGKEEEVKKRFDYLKSTDERPKLSVCYNVVVYTGSCNTHSVVIYVRGSHNMDEILKMYPFCFMEDLEVEEGDSFDIKEAKSEWLDDNYNVVAYFEPYEPDFIGIDNKKGAIWQECGDRFQVRLQTKEELLRQYLKSMG